jgi:SP family myo-inositol transporter-like MFS transporter 13
MASSFNHVTYQQLPSSPSSSSQPGMSSITKKDPELEEILDDQLTSTSLEQEPVKATFFVYVLVFCVCVGGFLFGYDTGGMSLLMSLLHRKKKKTLLTLDYSLTTHLVISGALQPIQDEFGLDTVKKELVVGATTFGAIFGGFFAGMVSYSVTPGLQSDSSNQCIFLSTLGI